MTTQLGYFIKVSIITDCKLVSEDCFISVGYETLRWFLFLYSCSLVEKYIFTQCFLHKDIPVIIRYMSLCFEEYMTIYVVILHHSFYVAIACQRVVESIVGHQYLSCSHGFICDFEGFLLMRY